MEIIYTEDEVTHRPTRLALIAKTFQGEHIIRILLDGMRKNRLFSASEVGPDGVVEIVANFQFGKTQEIQSPEIE